MNNLDALLILNAIPGLGPKRIRALIEHFGSAEKVLSVSQEDLLNTGDLPEHAVLNLVHFSRDQFLGHEYDLLKSRGISVVTMDDQRYPQHLREISTGPVLLYVKGKSEVLKEPAIAIVGSRRASLYGLGVARRFAVELCEAGLSVISGLARGIDTAAHQGALQAQGVTIAVLGCGLDHMYPAENEDLAERIAQDGAIISEFPMETLPVSFNFPRRNRIISGLSHGVVVVEAALKSGALITSDFALEQGREVYAVPGQLGEPASQGANRLIQQGAKLVLSSDDILEDLAPVLKEFRPKKQEPDQDVRTDNTLSVEEQNMCQSFNDEPVHIDELADKAGLSVSQAALTLFKLELKRLVRQLPGQKFEKTKGIQEHKNTGILGHKSAKDHKRNL